MEANHLYKEELAKAISRTDAEGFIVEDTTVGNLGSKLPYFNESTYRTFMQSFAKTYSKPNGNFDLSTIKGKCLEVHNNMQRELLKDCKVESLLTIGYVNKLGQDMFKFENIASLPDKVTMDGKPSLNFHVWLTLPSYEIVDFTFIAHFEYTNSPPHRQALLRDAPSYIANFGNASAILEEEQMLYHPLYVGKDVLVRSGLIVQSGSR